MTPEQGPLSSLARHEIRVALDRHLSQHKLSRADLAKAIGVSQSEISECFGGKTKNERRESEILQLANNWMEDDCRARDAERPSDFVETSVAQIMFGTMIHLRRRKDIAIGTGPAGVGKSKVIAALLAEVSGTFAVVITSDSRGATGFKAALNAALSTRRAKRGPCKIAQIVERLKQGENVKTPRVLLVDQAHEMSDKALRVLIDLHELCNLSIFLLGTIDLRDRISDDDDPLFGQLSSRVGLRVDLTPQLSGGRGPGGSKYLFTVPEMRKLFRSGKVRMLPAAAALLRDIANHELGHLRRAGRIFDCAVWMCEQASRDEIDRRDIVAAASFVDGKPYVPPLRPDPDADHAAEREAASA